MGFAEDIKKFEQKALLSANKSVCNAFEYVATQAVILSPEQPTANFATGLLKNSFYAKVGGFDLTVGTTANPSGNSSLSSIKAAVAAQPFLGKDNTITLTNSVDHSYRANYLGWPQGEGANGWVWSGKVTAYNFIGQAVNNFRGAYD